MTEKRKASKKRKGSKDVLNAYLLGGMSDVKSLNEKFSLSRKTLIKALRVLKKSGRDYKELEGWCKETFGFGLENRRPTRTAPQIGEEREYTAMGKPGSPIGKHPLKTLGLDTGDKYKAAFLEGKIILMRA